MDTVEPDVYCTCAYPVLAPVADMIRSAAPRGGNTTDMYRQHANEDDDDGWLSQRHFDDNTTTWQRSGGCEVMATTASWHKSRHKKETEGAESIGDLKEPQSAESALSAATTDVGAQREQEQQRAGEGLGRAQRAWSQMRYGSTPPHRNELDVQAAQVHRARAERGGPHRRPDEGEHLGGA